MEILAVGNEEALRRVFDFGDLVLNYTAISNTVYNWEFWMEQLRRNPQLLLFAQKNGEIVGAVCGWVGKDNNVTVGMVAVGEAHRRQGIGKRLMTELVRRIKAEGHPTIALGAAKEAEGFYLKFPRKRPRTCGDFHAGEKPTGS